MKSVLLALTNDCHAGVATPAFAILLVAVTLDINELTRHFSRKIAVVKDIVCCLFNILYVSSWS